MPDKITIFKKPIEAEARLLMQTQSSNSIRSYAIAKITEVEKAKRGSVLREKVRKLVSDTVWHEVAHHFGLTEREVEEREWQRQQP